MRLEGKCQGIDTWEMCPSTMRSALAWAALPADAVKAVKVIKAVKANNLVFAMGNLSSRSHGSSRVADTGKWSEG